MGRVFSGVKPTSEAPHLGNYLGAFRNWVAQQDEHECLFCVVDLHSITVPPWEPKSLARRTRQIAASLIAAGIDPKRSILFVQSDVGAHTELAWILTCLSRMGELSRMTQYKDKSSGMDQRSVSAGLFAYPVLMAADVLAYRADLVPIGDDQKQHLELMRDIAQRFNRELGETFAVPEPFISKQGARIMSLDDPTAKMDKSAERPSSVIWMTDPPDVVRKKISRAITDSGREVAYGKDKPAVSNLLDIYALLSGVAVDELLAQLEGKGYAELKAGLTEAVVAFLTPFQERYNDLMDRLDELDEILDRGAEQARALADETLTIVRERVGLRRP